MIVGLPYGHSLAQLQGSLSANSASAAGPGNQIPAGQPHHPITCQHDLRLEEDGTFSCPHATVPPDDPRTQAALDASAAYLLFEVLTARELRQAS